MSLVPPIRLTTKPTPKVGSVIPSLEGPALVLVLRHPGCPFAEATLQDLATLWSKKPPGVKVKVVLHGDEEIAKGWLGECTKDPKYKLPEDVEIVIDGPDLALRKELGFGWTSLAHFLGPGSLGGVFKLKRERGVANRFPETGNRWLTAAAVAVDASGKVTYVHVPSTASELPDIGKAFDSLTVASKL